VAAAVQAGADDAVRGLEDDGARTRLELLIQHLPQHPKPVALQAGADLEVDLVPGRSVQ